MALFNNPSRVIAGCVFAVILTFALALYLTGALARGANGRAEAKLSTGQLGAAQASGRDAVNTAADRAASEAAADALTMENDHAIRSAAGADAPVDPAVAAAGLYGLCQRRAYSGEQRCMQFTPAR